MGEKLRQEEQTQPDYSSRYEHLAEGFKPIMACVGTRSQYDKEIEALEEMENVGHNADIDAHPDLLEMRGFKSAGLETYVMSPVDEKPKFTDGVLDCTTLAVVGNEKDTGKPLSLMTHQNPNYFLKKFEKDFDEDLRSRLQEIKDRCTHGSVDIVIAGGKFIYGVGPENYKKSLEKISGIVQDMFGFDPLVICGPKFPRAASDKVYLDAKDRRIYIIRPENSYFSNDVFQASKVDEKIKEWEERGVFMED